MSSATSVFNSYAGVYDALYADKDYAGEAARVAQVLRKRAPAARRLLELGCGTGLHAIALARAGYEVAGIDLSEAMLERAAGRRAALPAALQGKLRFGLGDVRRFRAGEQYDAVFSLFHVLSYQAAIGEMEAMFATAAAHLASGGLFLFDFWHGPGVLAQKPEPREKRARARDAEVLRRATPVLLEAERCVEVRYDVRILVNGAEAQRMGETHRMRYFFMPEIEAALHEAGMSMLSAGESLDGAPPDESNWAASVVAQRH